MTCIRPIQKTCRAAVTSVGNQFVKYWKPTTIICLSATAYVHFVKQNNYENCNNQVPSEDMNVCINEQVIENVEE